MMYKPLAHILILFSLTFAADRTTSKMGSPARPYPQSLREFQYEISQKWNKGVDDLDSLFDGRIDTLRSTVAYGDSCYFQYGKIDTLYPQVAKAGLVFVGSGVGLPCASMWIHEDTVAITIDTANVYIKIDGWTAGVSNGVLFNADTSGFVVPVVGLYKIDWQISGDPEGNNKNFEVDIHVNGVEQEDGSAKRDFGAAGSLGSLSGTAIIRVTNTSHEIDIRAKNTDDTTDLDIFNASFNILHVGG